MLLLIGLGGNEGDVLRAFGSALAGLAREVPVVARSSVWCSEPLGPPQPDFMNAAVLVDVQGHPGTLLTLCQHLEAEAGRDRSREPRLGPRPLDLDFLIARRLVVESATLTLPHPRLAERRFALAPAAELAPEWLHPRLHATLEELAGSPIVAAQRCALAVPPGAWGVPDR